MIDSSLLPDPARGVFSTALVVHGEVIELGAHLRRLDASVQRLYGNPLPEGLASDIRKAAAGVALARLRITVVPHTPELDSRVTVTPIPREIVLPGWDRALHLRSVRVPAWRGPHKFDDRRLLEDLDARCAPDAALLVDDRHQVLETSRANVFVVTGDGTVCTPPADGRVLPGIARSSVLQLAREEGVPVCERALGLDEATGAREVFTTGSIRGIEPVATLDGIAISGPGRLSGVLSRRLEARWFGRGGATAPAEALA